MSLLDPLKSISDFWIVAYRECYNKSERKLVIFYERPSLFLGAGGTLLESPLVDSKNGRKKRCTLKRTSLFSALGFVRILSRATPLFYL